MTRQEWEELNRRYRRYRDFGAEDGEVSWLLSRLGRLVKESEPQIDPKVWEWVMSLKAPIKIPRTPTPAVAEEEEDQREWGQKVAPTYIPRGTPLRNRTPLVHPGEPRAIVRRVYAVQCPNCLSLVPSPFNGDPLWTNEHFIIRARSKCPDCGQRFKVK